MSPELIGIVTIGIAMTGMFVGLFAWLRSDIRDLSSRMDGMDERLRSDIHDLSSRMDGMDERLRVVETGLAGVQGQLAGMQGQITGMQGQITGMQAQLAFLQDYITGRNTRAAPPPGTDADE